MEIEGLALQANPLVFISTYTKSCRTYSRIPCIKKVLVQGICASCCMGEKWFRGGDFLSYKAFTVTGAKAYYATYNSAAATVTLKEIEGAVPAEEGVILKGNEGDVVGVAAAASATAIEGNSLKGVTANTSAFAAGNNYVLASNGTLTAFIQMADDKTVSGMLGKAYLNIPASEAKSIIYMDFEDAPTATISAVADAPSAENGNAYNVLGQRVASSAKGLVIRNGKKFIIK